MTIYSTYLSPKVDNYGDTGCQKFNFVLDLWQYTNY